MAVSPFVVGQWVRGRKFYGRTELLEEILEGPREWLWLLGTRRIGKTSLLKQIEHLTANGEEQSFFPVFWDLQGSDGPEELRLGFGDALLDAEERLALLDITPDEVESEDLFRSLGLLRRKLRAKGRKLLLLCDEVEELIEIQQQDPSVLRKLRRALQSREDVRCVMASTIRLWALADEQGDTSPFLHGFTPPLYIHNLADSEARALIAQANLPSDSRPAFGDEIIERIRARCDNHPYLIQLLCKRYMELGDLEEATHHVAVDPMLGHFFTVDFRMLSDVERAILRLIAEQDSSTSNTIQDRLGLETGRLGGVLHRLEHLGYIRRNAEQRFVLINYFFRRWFRELPDELQTGPSVEPRPDGSGDRPAVPSGSSATQLGILGDRYELQQKVGEGAMGVVYRALDSMLDATIAVKVLRKGLAENDEALERLRREILLSRDIAHPNIVRIYHLGESSGIKFLTLQWIEGETLAKRIAREAPLSVARSVEIGSKLAGALEAAHACRVLHRDIKPLNILIREDGEPLITDFGLARLVGGPGTTRDGVFVGTPDYSSPEQARGWPVDERADIYALGLVLFEMLTGRRPFVASSSADVLELHRSAMPPDPRSLRPAIPDALAELVLRCLEKDRQRRIASAAELREVLAKAGDSRG